MKKALGIFFGFIFLSSGGLCAMERRLRRPHVMRLIKKQCLRIGQEIILTREIEKIDQELRDLGSDRAYDECCHWATAIVGNCAVQVGELDDRAEFGFEKAVDWLARIALCGMMFNSSHGYYQESLKKSARIKKLLERKNTLLSALDELK